jgi:hypothetical protein
MPGNMPSAAKGRVPDRDAAPQGVVGYRLHDDPAVRRGASGRRRALDRVRRFTASAVVRRVENLYERLIAGGSTRQ